MLIAIDSKRIVAILTFTFVTLLISASTVLAQGGRTVQFGTSPDTREDTMASTRQTSLSDQAKGFIDDFLSPKLSTPHVTTPEDYGMGYEEVSFRTHDGVTISGWLVKGGFDKVVIQAHPVTTNRSGMDGSNGGRRTELLKTAKAFVEAGYSVLAFDARNHGQSEIGPQPFIIGTIDDAPDFVAAVDYLASRPDYRVARVGIHAVCFGSNATASAFGLEDGLQSRSSLRAISLTQPASWGMLLRNNPDVPDALVDEINAQLIARGAPDLDQLPLAYASSITVPTMIVQNQNDPHFVRSFIEDFHAAIPEEKELRWIEGAQDRADIYHYQTEHPEMLVEWFERHMGE